MKESLQMKESLLSNERISYQNFSKNESKEKCDRLRFGSTNHIGT